MQGRHCRLVPGAQRAAAGAARRMAGRDHRGTGGLRPRPSRSAVAPFAVNQIVHKSNNRLEQDMANCASNTKCRSSSPRSARAGNQRRRACLWRHRAARHDQRPPRPQGDREGRRRPDRGGGRRRRPCRHAVAVRAGPGNPRWFDGPLLLSGAIANGGAVLAAQAMGADLAYIGSAFIATKEARAAEAYKQMIVDRQGRRHRLHQPVYRRARQLSESLDRQRRSRSRQPAAIAIRRR